MRVAVKPLSVRLHPRPAQTPADEEARFECAVKGSRPPATVTWWKTRRGGQEEHHFGVPHVSGELPGDHQETFGGAGSLCLLPIVLSLC